MILIASPLRGDGQWPAGFLPQCRKG